MSITLDILFIENHLDKCIAHFHIRHSLISRYWAVTNVDYIHSRTTGRVFMMIFFVWVTGVIVSLAPQFGWKDAEYLQRIEQQKCMVSQDIGYQVCTRNDKIHHEIRLHDENYSVSAQFSFPSAMGHATRTANHFRHKSQRTQSFVLWRWQRAWQGSSGVCELIVIYSVFYGEID